MRVSPASGNFHRTAKPSCQILGRTARTVRHNSVASRLKPSDRRLPPACVRSDILPGTWMDDPQRRRLPAWIRAPPGDGPPWQSCDRCRTRAHRCRRRTNKHRARVASQTWCREQSHAVARSAPVRGGTSDNNVRRAQQQTGLSQALYIGIGCQWWLAAGPCGSAQCAINRGSFADTGSGRWSRPA